MESRITNQRLQISKNLVQDLFCKVIKYPTVQSFLKHVHSFMSNHPVHYHGQMVKIVLLSYAREIYRDCKRLLKLCNKRSRKYWRKSPRVITSLTKTGNSNGSLESSIESMVWSLRQEFSTATSYSSQASFFVNCFDFRTAVLLLLVPGTCVWTREPVNITNMVKNG